jgi:hypothetical protein
MKEQLGEARDEAAMLKTDLRNMANRLGVDSSKVNSAVWELIDQDTELRIELDRCDKKLKHHRKHLKAQIIHLARMVEERDSVLTDQREVMDKLQQEKVLLESELEKFQKEVYRLEAERKTYQVDYKNQLSERDLIHAAEISDLETDFDQQIQEVKNEVHEKEFALKTTTEEATRLKHELAQWKRACELLKLGKAEQEAEVQRMKESVEEIECDVRRVLQQEKDMLKASYEGIVHSLKEKNESLDESIRKSSESLANSDRRCMALNAKISQLSTEKQQLSYQLNAQKEDNQRFTRLMEAKLKAVMLASEAS